MNALIGISIMTDKAMQKTYASAFEILLLLCSTGSETKPAWLNSGTSISTANATTAGTSSITPTIPAAP